MIRQTPHALRKNADAARDRLNRRVKACLGTPRNSTSEAVARLTAALRCTVALIENTPDDFGIFGKLTGEDREAVVDAVQVCKDIFEAGRNTLGGDVSDSGKRPPTDRARLAPVATGQRIMSREHFNTLGHAQRGRLLAEGALLTDDCQSANFFPAPERNILGRVEK